VRSWMFGEVPPAIGPGFRAWVERNVLGLMFLAALLIVASGLQGCKLPKINLPEPPKQDSNCPQCSCPSGQDCTFQRAYDQAGRVVSCRSVCQPSTLPPVEQPNPGTTAPNPGTTIPLPTPEPPVAQPPVAGCSIDGEPGAPIPGHVSQHGAAVNAALQSVTGQEGGRIVVAEGRQAFQSRVIAQLRAAGLCAGQHAPDTDEIAVASSPTAPREGYHVYAGPWSGPGTAVLSPQADRGAYAAPQMPTPEGGTGTPTAPSSPTVCGEPVPLRTYPDGTAHWFFRCSPWGGPNANITDCSVKVKGQPEFCFAVWGKADLNCDLGPEATPERECRERLLYGSTLVEGRNGAECWQYGDNPMQVQGTRRGDCRLCSTADPAVCSEWF
jgi:hypothetical protein